MMLKPTLITYTIIYTLFFWYRFSCAVMFYSLIGVVMCLRCFDSRFAFLLDRCAWAGPLDPPEGHEAMKQFFGNIPEAQGERLKKKAMCFKHNKIIQNDNEPHNFWNWSSGGFLGQVVHVCATCDMLMIVDATAVDSEVSPLQRHIWHIWHCDIVLLNLLKLAQIAKPLCWQAVRHAREHFCNTLNILLTRLREVSRPRSLGP